MSTPPTSDVVVTRDYDFDDPTLLLRRDVFGSVSTPVGAAAEEADAASSAPTAHATGPPLLPHSATNQAANKLLRKHFNQRDQARNLVRRPDRHTCSSI